MYGIAPEMGCFIAKSFCSVNSGLVFMVFDGDEILGILFKFGLAMVSLWRNKHFDPAVLADAC